MKYIWKFFNFILGLNLALMGIFIFVNVLLRYIFNTGLPWAEEMSRFLFVWLVFLGAVGATKDNAHLGFTTLVQGLPEGPKKVVYIISNAIVLYVLYALFVGSWQLTTMSTNTLSPATGLPLSYMYGIGVINAGGIFLIVLYNTYRALFVKGAINELVVLRESEDERDFSADAAMGGRK